MTQPTLTPRQRKLRGTATILAWLAGLVVLFILVTHYRNRPSPYDPEEESEVITSNLRLNLPQAAPDPIFEDITEQAGLSGFRTFQGPRTSQLPEDMGGGAAFGDFDNDGDDDLFLVSAGGHLNLPTNELPPSQLYRNRGDGTFDNVSTFPELRIRGMGAAWGDYDGDGFIDLAVTGYQSLHLFRNESGTGRFTEILLPGDHTFFWAGASWADFDNDRDLDLYISGYLEYHVSEADLGKTSAQNQTAVPYTLNPASFEPAKNRLYRNDGNNQFTDIAEPLDVTNPTGRSLGAIWCDFDQDGWLDLYVANDVSDNAFYRNQQTTFTDIAHAAWMADYRSAMGMTAADWNNDGDDDLFITHWVAQENALYDNTFADFNTASPSSRESTPVTHPTSPGNAVDTEKPKARFVDVADMHGIGQMALPYVGWGTEFVDLDHDGWLDLLVANGSTLEIPEQIPKQLQPQEMFFLWNHAGGAFHNLSGMHSGFSEKHISRGLATSDIDGDGDIDFVIVDMDGGARLYRNDMTTGNWVQCRLRSLDANQQLTGRGEHAVITVYAGPKTFRRSFNSVSYLSQSTATLHIGLGALSVIDRIEVKWHAGNEQTFTGISPNAVWELQEGNPNPKRVTPTPSTESVSADIDTTGSDERARTVAFWKHQRTAMNLFKQDQNYEQAIASFKQALAINPHHEDALFYYASSLIELNQIEDAMRQLEKLSKVNPQSLRAFQQWGTLRALTAKSATDLETSESLLLKARAINPEETGVLQLLGEVALKRGNMDKADERLAHVISSNPRAARAIYLRAFIAMTKQDDETSASFLKQARKALGPEWQPKGTTSEGDVRQQMHIHTTPYSQIFSEWNGSTEPQSAFGGLGNLK